MQRLQSVLAVLALALTTWLVVGDGLPNTFRECVVRGGDLGMIGADVTCRYVETSTLRTYVMG
ncbi:MAG TPA: hypothetical protein VNZ58_03455, partial [Thermomicrobiales bacterium]|nr:hypothetical protein [Thermomicrobiales bacterium]